MIVASIAEELEAVKVDQCVFEQCPVGNGN